MNYLISFIVGGILCIPAQILLDKTKLTNARILTGYVVSGVILYAVGLYEPLYEFAATGASIPLTGFGYSLAMGVEEAISEQGLFGVVSGGLSATAAGISTALLLGVIMSLLFKSRQK